MVSRFRPALWPFIWAHALAGFIAAHGKEALGLDADSWLQGLVAGGHWAVLLGGSAAALTAVFNEACGAERGVGLRRRTRAERRSRFSTFNPHSALRTPHSALSAWLGGARADARRARLGAGTRLVVLRRVPDRRDPRRRLCRAAAPALGTPARRHRGAGVRIRRADVLQRLRRQQRSRVPRGVLAAVSLGFIFLFRGAATGAETACRRSGASGPVLAVPRGRVRLPGRGGNPAREPLRDGAADRAAGGLVRGGPAARPRPGRRAAAERRGRPRPLPGHGRRRGADVASPRDTASAEHETCAASQCAPCP